MRAEMVRDELPLPVRMADCEFESDALALSEKTPDADAL